MASRIVLVILYLTIAISVVFADWEFNDVTPDILDDNTVTVEEIEDYFMAKRNGFVQHHNFLDDLVNMDKRRIRKLGACKTPGGKTCELCNLRVRNKSDMRRYIACHNSRRG